MLRKLPQGLHAAAAARAACALQGITLLDMRLGRSGKHRALKLLLSRDSCLTASMDRLIACIALDG